MNPDDYFNTRFNQSLLPAEPSGASTKFDALQKASRDKVAALDAGIAKAKARELANASSLVGRLDLDPNGIAGQAVNLGASVYSGGARVIGDVAGFVGGDFETMVRMGVLSNEEIDAVGRFRNGEATEADVQLINRRKSADSYTALENADLADKARARSASINKTFDQSSLIHGDRREALSEDLGDEFQGAWDQVKSGAKAVWNGKDLAGGAGDVVSGVAKLLYNAGEAAVTNPGAAAEYIAENLPQLAIGVAGRAGKAALLASNVGYASEEYQKGIAKYQAENGGAYPDQATRMEMAAYASSLALAEQVGDLSVLRGATGAAKAVEDTARIGFKQSLKNVSKETGKGVATEGVTEGWQTFAEGQANLDPASAQQIYEGAVIGGIAGGGLQGGGRALGEVLKATPEHLKVREAENAVILARREAQEAAIATGDVTALLDPKNGSYSPSNAIAALAGNAALPEATPEIKEANLAKASEILAELQEERAAIEQTKASMSPEGLEATRKAVAEAEAAGDVELAKGLRSDLAFYSKLDAKKVDSDLARVDRRLTQANKALSDFVTNSKIKEAEIDTSTETAINLSMAVPERLKTADALALANDETNDLSTEQRSYLRAFSDARIAENKAQNTDLVTEMVLFGDKKTGNVGLAQYRERVTAALLAGNKKLATQQLDMLRKFNLDHKAKAEVVALAWGEGKGTQTERTKDGRWLVSSRFRSKAELTKSGDLAVNTPVLVDAIRAESQAISAVLAELEAAMAVKSSPTTKGTSNVTNVSQALDSTQGNTADAPVQGVESTGDATPGTTGGTSEGLAPGSQGGRGVPESGGVAQKTDSTEQPSVDIQSETVESTATTEVSASSESSEKTSEDEVGKVSALSRTTDAETAYSQRELVGDFFNQSSGKETDTTKRPLVAVKDFLSSGWDKVTEFVGSAELNDKQKALMSTFQAKAKEWSKTIQSNLARRNRDFWYEDLVQFLMTEEGGKLDLDENVKTAMSYAAFSWIAENLAREPYNTDEEINLILGRDEDHEVSDAERRALRDAGTRQNVIANALGQRAVQALGLKAKKDAPLDLMPKLESQLGTHIMKMLMDQGLLDRNEMSGLEFAVLRGDVTAEAVVDLQRALEAEGVDLSGAPKSKWLGLAVKALGQARVDEFLLASSTQFMASQSFIQLQRDEQTEEIFQASRGTQGLLDNLFGVEPGLKEPSREPVKFTQNTTRNTDQGIPSKLKEIMEQENAGASFVRQDMFNLFALLGEPIALQIAGADLTDENSIHKANRSSVQAKNDGLKRELKRGMEFFSDLFKEDSSLAMPIFFDHTVWKQQRVGIATNVVNPQTSKIHRHMLFRKSWETVIEFTDAAQMDNFMLRVAEGLGIKTDKQGNDVTLDASGQDHKKHVGAKLRVPEIKAAVQVLQKYLTDLALSPEDQKTLLAGVKAGGENMHSLDALMALAHMAVAKEAKPPKTSFTVQMMGEVDGVTNGPMLSHLLMGAAKTVEQLFGLVNRGGFFEQGNRHDQYNQWRGDAGNFDLYETTAGHMVTAVQGLIRNGLKLGKSTIPGKEIGRVANAIYAFTGELADKNDVVQKAGRNIVKTPLTAMVFGSSVTAAVESMANKFVESIYAAIEDTANGRKDSMSRDDLVKHINTIIEFGGGEKLNVNISMEKLMDGDLDGAELVGVKRAFKMTIGQAVSDTMKEDFAVFIEKRRQFNTAAQTTFELYNSVHETMRKQMVDELVAKHPKTGKALHDLTAAQERDLQKKLRDLFPVMHTAFSQESGSLKGGLLIAKTARKLSSQDAYSGNVKFATGFSDNGAKSTTTHAYERSQTAPGVGMAPMSVHSLDSYISHIAAMLGEVLNVHDAHGAGVANFEETARNLNEATWKALLLYSPASEMQAALSRTVVGLAKMVKAGTLSPEVLQSILKNPGLNKIAAKEEVAPADLIGYMMRQTKALAFQADDIKLQAQAQAHAFDQYALEGGNYLVTDDDRDAAEAKRKELKSELSAAEEAAIEVLEDALGGTREVTEKAEVLPEEDTKVVTSPFGVIGTPVVQSDPKLVEFLSQDKSAKQVLQMLMGRLKETAGRTTEVNQQLVRLLYKVVSPDLMVRMVSTEMGEGDVQAMPATPSHAWYVAQGKEESIYVLSPEFKDSGLTVETLLHELVHGGLAKVVDTELKAEKANSKYTSDALELVRELDELREKAAAYAKQNSITGFDAALKDLQEFIAYGMTNPVFQRQVLNQISMKSRTQGNSLVNGMKAFIERIVGILFKGSSKDSQAQATNGMTVLISNVSGLFSQAAQGQDSDTRLNLSMAANTVLNDYSTMDIHNALAAGNLTPEFSEKLQGLLIGIVQKLHGPFGALKASLTKQQTLTAQDVWLKALSTDEAPFASSVLKAPMVVSEQEAHALEQVEAVVRAALDHKESSTTAAYKELAKVFVEARAALKPSDFKDANAYDFIFKIEGGADGRSNYLARFAAFALAHQEFSGLLNKVNLQPAPKGAGKTFGERIQKIFEQILAFLHEKATNTFKGQATDVRVEKLVGQLIDIEAKRRVVLARPVAAASLIEAKASELATKAKDKALDVLRSPGLRNHPKAAVRAIAKVGGLALEQRLQDFTEAAKDVWDAQIKERHGIALQLLKEIQGPGKLLNLLALASTNAQRVRKEIISSTTKHVRSAFANGGKDITREQSKAITQVFLRTGVHTLVGRFNMTELENLLGDPKAVQTAIDDTKNLLNSFGRYKDQFIHQANALGYFRTTGVTEHERLMMNAHNIVRLYGTGVQSTLSETETKAAEEIVAQLVALYGLKYSNKDSLSLAKDVLHIENQRSDGLGNGVDYTLKFQKWLEDESHKRVFAGQQALMMHGYTPEITNPNIQVVVATKEEGEELEKHGYVLVGEAPKDIADPNKEAKYLYSVLDGGLMAYRSGITSLTGKRAKGTTIHSGYLNVNTAEGLENASNNADIQHKKPAGLAKGPEPDLGNPNRPKGHHMVPVVNPSGEIVNWRYMMADETRDNTLQRDNSFDKILGVLHGSTVDKESSTELNTKVFEALKAIHTVQQHRTPEAFVLIGPGSTDPEMREIWSMLPEDTRAVARKLWNRDGMYVRKDQLTHVFGYRKFSLADALRKDPSQRGTLEKVYATAIENTFAMYAQLRSPGTSRKDAEEYAKRAAVYVARGERVWQDIVKEIKDIIVVKSVVVSLGNISSNISLLLAQGVPLKDVLRGHLVALRGARAHQQDSEELKRLQSIIDTGTAGTRLASIQTEIARLKDAIARNPVKEMIDAGLMPTIVEDIAEEDDVYSYKSTLIRKTEKYTSKLPQGVQDAARQVYMARDTKLYQGLSRLAQVSDFAGRYVLYQHMVNRKQNPLSKEDAVHQASEAFINYDIPMPKFLQFTDDMGITMFTKYVLRIQRVLVRIAEENPARVLLMLTLDQFVNLGPIVLDSSWVNKIGNNPLNWGALQLPGAVDELATVNAALALVK